MAYKVGKGKPPKSTQFKKGQSGNPEGARKHNQDLKKLKACLKREIDETLNLLLQSDIDKLNHLIKSKDSDVLTLALASVLSKSIKKGDWYALKGLFSFVTNNEASRRRIKQLKMQSVEVEKRLI